ncbi:outer membrane beta-barrel protein [Pedobacter sp. PAMC26386]|nr:outer membrane beta-barrel protein [Pedobacter sp. PAMC26386]
MRFKKIVFPIVLSCILSSAVKSQTTELGINAGAAGYIGDINPNKLFKPSGVAFGAYVKRNLDPYWAIGLHYNYGHIKGDDLKSNDASLKARGLNFSTALNELSLQVDFNFLEYFSGGGRQNFTPYMFAGIGGVLFNPKATYTSTDGKTETYELRYYETEGKKYKNYAVSIPYGIGMKYRIGERLGIFTQLGYRTAKTDYLDDVGDRYPQIPVSGNNGTILSDPTGIGTPGAQRGNFVKNDTYFFIHIGLSYTFTSDKCYSF